MYKWRLGERSGLRYTPGIGIHLNMGLHELNWREVWMVTTRDEH